MNATSLSLLQTITTTDNSLSLEQRSVLQELIAGRLPTRSRSNQPLLLTQKDTAKLLSISRVTLWRMTKDGIFNPVEILPGTFRYRTDEIESVISRKVN
jgi:predicted DNA-binding transcriptional regulator AlpA